MDPYRTSAKMPERLAPYVPEPGDRVQVVRRKTHVARDVGRSGVVSLVLGTVGGGRCVTVTFTSPSVTCLVPDPYGEPQAIGVFWAWELELL